MQLFNLAGKNVVVTGAGSGLGQAFAYALAAAGGHVICADIQSDAAADTASAIRVRGQSASAAVLDVSEPVSVDAFARLIAADHGALHALVNNAGITSLPMRTHKVSVTDWDRVMAVNLRGTFLCSRALIPLLLRSPLSSIVNVSSVIGEIGIYPGFAVSAVPYASSKAAVIGLTRQMAVEYARDGLRVNAIIPGWHGGTQLGRERRATATPEDRKQFEDHIVSSVPMGRRGEPQELHGLVVYLTSDASGYVTGQSFAHDGGLTAA